jgi:hypothetical protein
MEGQIRIPFIPPAPGTCTCHLFYDIINHEKNFYQLKS